MERFLLWKCFWAKMFDGLVGIFTLGYIQTNWSLNSAKRLSQWRNKHSME